MRTREKIDIDVEAVNSRIKDCEELHQMATFAGADSLLGFLGRTKDYYVKAMQCLNEGDPNLNREYAKHKACLGLVNGWLIAMNNYSEVMEELRLKSIDLIEEVKELNKVMKERERNKF